MSFDTTKIKGPKWLKQAFSDVDAKIEANKPISGIGTQVFDSAGGRPINAFRGAGGGGTSVGGFPFQILSAGQNLGVAPESNLFKNLKGEAVTITGLLSDETDMSDPGWFACPAIGEKIWLQIGTWDPSDTSHTLNLYAGTTQIRSGAAGGSLWDEYPDPISLTGSGTASHQEFYNLLLAEVTDPETDTRPAIATVTIGTGDAAEKRQVTQCWSRNVTTVFWSLNGSLCLVPSDPAPDYPPSAL